MRIFTRSLFIAVLSLFALNINAQDEEKSLNERVGKLEGIVSKLPAISGLVNGRFQYSDKDEISKFDVRRARLDLKGNISSSVDYRLHVEFAPSNPKILDAYVRWKINPYFNVQFGQNKFPFSLENPYNPVTLETIENSTVIAKLSGYSDEAGIGGNGRDIGLSFYGGFIKKEGYNLIDYNVGIFNGNGLNSAENNKEKDFIGILTVNPIKDLALAVSYYNGKTTVSKTANSVTTLVDNKRIRTGFGAKYDNKKLLVRSEYIFGETGDKESNGYYVTGAYFVTSKFQPVLKYDYYGTSLNDVDTELTNYIVGINYYPIKNLRLQLNYTYRDVKDADAENIVAAQILLSF